MGNATIAEALRGVANAAEIMTVCGDLDQMTVMTVADARSVADALEVVAQLPAKERVEPLFQLCALMQSVESKEVFDTLNKDAMPVVERIFQSTIHELGDDAGDLLMALKILAMYRYKNAVSLIANAVRSGYKSSSWFWTVVIGALPKDNEMRVELCNALSSSLPEDFVGVAFLDFCNETALHETMGPSLKRHPFDSIDGENRLERYLANPNPDEFSYAHSAAATLAFVSSERRERLLSIALEHPDPRVHAEAAWASSRCGSEAALEILAQLCLDMRVSKLACEYMQEFDHHEMIPEAARVEEFQAAAELVQWIESVPLGDGGYPERIWCVDNRELNWPPTNDRRRLWVYHWEFGPRPWREERIVRVGMTGGLRTHCFFDTVQPDWPIDDIYAIHCSWEAAQSEDESIHPPDKYSIEHGRQLLQNANSQSTGLGRLFKRFRR